MTALNVIRQNFASVLSLRQDIANIFESLDSKITVLQTTYADLLNTHENMRSLFGMDSFFFQNELLEIEHNNMNCIFTKIDNRLYCEYYNLFRMIQNYIIKDIQNKEIIQKTKCNKRFPVFKHLDKIKKYDINLVIDLQNFILSYVMELGSYLEQEEIHLNSNSKHAEMGLNIDNLLHHQRFSNTLLKEKINMYTQYLNTFHIHHTKYYTRLLLKLKLLVGVVNEDILIKRTSKQIANKKTQRVNEFENGPYRENIQTLMNEISPETKSSLDKALSCITTDEIPHDNTTYNDSFPEVNPLSKDDIKVLEETKELIREANLSLQPSPEHYKDNDDINETVETKELIHKDTLPLQPSPEHYKDNDDINETAETKELIHEDTLSLPPSPEHYKDNDDINETAETKELIHEDTLSLQPSPEELIHEDTLSLPPSPEHYKDNDDINETAETKELIHEDTRPLQPSPEELIHEDTLSLPPSPEHYKDNDDINETAETKELIHEDTLSLQPSGDHNKDNKDNKDNDDITPLDV